MSTLALGFLVAERKTPEKINITYVGKEVITHIGGFITYKEVMERANHMCSHSVGIRIFQSHGDAMSFKRYMEKTFVNTRFSVYRCIGYEHKMSTLAVGIVYFCKRIKVIKELKSVAITVV